MVSCLLFIVSGCVIAVGVSFISGATLAVGEEMLSEDSLISEAGTFFVCACSLFWICSKLVACDGKLGKRLVRRYIQAEKQTTSNVTYIKRSTVFSI